MNAVKAAGSGRGWRPLRPSPTGDERSLSMWAWKAPGRWLTAWASRPESGLARSYRQSTKSHVGSPRRLEASSQDTRGPNFTMAARFVLLLNETLRPGAAGAARSLVDGLDVDHVGGGVLHRCAGN